ncbi:vacuolar sorting protein VPS33/slp1 [Globomyces sp. JEL0801]|nr:vacuolar sorting protein VPS33/slp1 [Globomyces sp. JEL0801]
MSQKRQPFPNYEAIYFVTPTVKTIDKIIADFKQDKPVYLAAHIFFISSLDDAFVKKIKESGIVGKYIKTLKEMNVDFIALEQQIFSLDMPLSMFPLYSPSSLPFQHAELQKITKKLMSLLITLGDAPAIRYFDPSGSKDGVASKLAHMLSDEVNTLVKENDPSYPVKNDYRKTVLLIVDRSFDMMAPLLHEFTYQAMVQDLICGDKSKLPEGVTGITHPLYFSPLPMYASLDESDPVWMTTRHWHFEDAKQHISSNFNTFLNENKAASVATSSASQTTGIDALKQMKETLASLPQFHAQKAQFSIHINMLQECNTLLTRRKLDLVASVQQDLATGEKSNATPLKNAMLDLIPVLDHKATLPNDKLRSLMIYIIAMQGIHDVERKRLLETAKFTPDDSQAINNLSFFNVRLSSMMERPKEADLGRYSYWGSVRQERKKNKHTEVYELSRYVPLIKRLLQDQIGNNVPKDCMPWVSEPSADELGISNNNNFKLFKFTNTNGIVPPDPNYPNSLRTTRASWAGQSRVRKSKDDPAKPELIDWRKNGSRIIVFSLGGLTYSEVRSAYEVSREAQREVYMGGTFLYHPTQFTDILRELHKGDLPILPASTPSQVNIEIDKKDEGKEKKGGLFSKKK